MDECHYDRHQAGIFYAPATRKLFIKLPAEDCLPGEEDAMNWAKQHTQHLNKIGFERGRASECNFVHKSKNIRLTGHGDDFIIVAPCKEIECRKWKRSMNSSIPLLDQKQGSARKFGSWTEEYVGHKTAINLNAIAAMRTLLWVSWAWKEWSRYRHLASQESVRTNTSKRPVFAMWNMQDLWDTDLSWRWQDQVGLQHQEENLELRMRGETERWDVGHQWQRENQDQHKAHETRHLTSECARSLLVSSCCVCVVILTHCTPHRVAQGSRLKLSTCLSHLIHAWSESHLSTLSSPFSNFLFSLFSINLQLFLLPFNFHEDKWWHCVLRQQGDGSTDESYTNTEQRSIQCLVNPE